MFARGVEAVRAASACTSRPCSYRRCAQAAPVHSRLGGGSRSGSPCARSSGRSPGRGLERRRIESCWRSARFSITRLARGRNAANRAPMMASSRVTTPPTSLCFASPSPANRVGGSAILAAGPFSRFVARTAGNDFFSTTALREVVASSTTFRRARARVSRRPRTLIGRHLRCRRLPRNMPFHSCRSCPGLTSGPRNSRRSRSAWAGNRTAPARR